MSKIEDKLAYKAEPILGFRPSSKVKRGRIGIIISIICLVYVIIELIKSGVIDIWNQSGNWRIDIINLHNGTQWIIGVNAE